MTVSIPSAICIQCAQAPGDILMITAAVRDLKRVVPNLKIYVETRSKELWFNNPYIEPLNSPSMGVKKIRVNYKPYLNRSPHTPGHFVNAIHHFLEDQLKIRIPITRFAGDIHMTPKEREAPRQIEEPYWLLVSGGKTDFTVKWWNPDFVDKVVEHYKGKIKFVQIGHVTKPDVYPAHVHFPAEGATNLLGKTPNLRELIKLMHHADGVLCPVTFLMHLAAAVPMPTGKRKSRPCVVVAGGREPPHWEAYPHHRFLHNVGQLSCCETGPCWARRAQLWPDSQPWNKRELCKQPVQVRDDLRMARCMQLITPEHVISAIDSYYGGDIALPQLS